MSSLSVNLKTTNNSEQTKHITSSLTYTGDLAYCLFRLEKVSGVDATHGGGANADRFLNYNMSGDTDFSSTDMDISLNSEGTGVYKVVAKLCTQTNYDSWLSDYRTWADTYLTHTEHSEGHPVATVADGAPDVPVETTETVKSDNITLIYNT